MKKNVRIQLFTPEGGMVGDRLVSQMTEFYAGPKEKHEGPIRIEFTLENKDDAESAITYLKQLVGDLPIGNKVKKVSTTTSQINSSEDKLEITTQLLEKYKDNQDELIKEFRDMGFYFVSGDYLKYLTPEAYNIKEIHTKNYQFMVKRIREAKDPKNDKYDPQIILGIKIMGERSDKVLLYAYGEYVDRFKLEVPSKKPLTFVKTNLIKYPPYMQEDERLKWGNEHRILFNTPDKKASKFYKRWYKDITVGDELRIDNLEERFE